MVRTVLPENKTENSVVAPVKYLKVSWFKVSTAIQFSILILQLPAEPINPAGNVVIGQPLNVALKLVTAVLYLNKSEGSEVNDVQPLNVLLKSVTAVLSLNNPDGIAVKDVQYKNVPLKDVAAVLYLNKLSGIDAKDVQS